MAASNQAHAGIADPAISLTEDAEGRQSTAFLLVYAFAWAGGAIAYVPFLTILLPLRIMSLFSPSEALMVLATLTFGGAVTASLANIASGYLSDIIGSRRLFLALGLPLNLMLLLQFGWVESPRALLVLIVLWQISLNMMLGPLSAWAGDCVPDRQKGVLGGLLALAPSLGALSGLLVSLVISNDLTMRLWLVALLVAGCMLPAILFARPRPIREPASVAAMARQTERLGFPRATVAMWFARLLVQLAEASLFAFLVLYFRSVHAEMAESSIAAIFAGVLTAAVPVAVLVGRWSDRNARPILPLVLAASAGGAGLLVMAASRTLPFSVAGYILFGLAIAVFLALHAGQTLRVLPRPDRRGRDLGLFNLTNTVPSIIVPVFAIALVPRLGFPALMTLLAVLALCSAVLLSRLAMRSRGTATV